MHYAFHDFIGNIGLVLLLGTYLLLQMGKIDSTRPLYSLLNALAALLIGVSLLFAFNMSAFLVEGRKRRMENKRINLIGIGNVGRLNRWNYGNVCF